MHNRKQEQHDEECGGRYVARERESEERALSKQDMCKYINIWIERARERDMHICMYTIEIQRQRERMKDRAREDRRHS